MLSREGRAVERIAESLKLALIRLVRGRAQKTRIADRVGAALIARHDRLSNDPDMLAVMLDGLDFSTLALWLPNTALLMMPIASISVVAAFGIKSAAKPLQGCSNCGYDLRCSSDRCPECGVPIASTPAEENATKPIERANVDGR